MASKKTPRIILGFLSLSLLIMMVSTAFADQKTITMAWLPNNSGENEKAFRAEFDKVISDATGYKVIDKLTTDYNIAIEALDSGDAQLGEFGPYEYLTGHAKNSKIIPLVVESGDSGTITDAMYYSRLLVKKGNESKYMKGSAFSVDNIVGKKISFVSTSSTSGFNMPASSLLGYFHTMDKYKSLTKDDLMQGGDGKFFSQVVFSGSHQMSLANLLKGVVDISAVDDVDVSSYLDLTSGTENQPGAVYTIRKGADAPFSDLAGSQFVVIKSIPILNTPLEANSAFLSPDVINKIVTALTSDKTKNDEAIFTPKDSTAASLFTQPHRFVKILDSDYDGMRKALGL